MENIFTVTAIHDIDEKNGADDTRCFGYYFDWQTADNRVRGNAGDINEYVYNYAVIEKFPEGLMQYAAERWFYKFDYDKRIYFPIDEPASVQHQCNFGIG